MNRSDRIPKFVVALVGGSILGYVLTGELFGAVIGVLALLVIAPTLDYWSEM